MDLSHIFENVPLIGRFALVFGLIVLLPRLAEKIKLPGVVGLICGGILLGPEILGLVNPKGSAFLLFSELGKLLLMFFAGFEINLSEFKKVGKRAGIFGFLTFIIPLGVGYTIGQFLNLSVNTSLLIGSLMASHTLLGLPIAQQLGISKNKEVVVTIGATIFTDIASMLVLAICLSVHLSGFSPRHLSLTILELAIYIPLVIFGLSWIARKLFEKIHSEEMRFAILLLVIACASTLAQYIELEGIVGAFLTGIAVNRAIGNEHRTGITLQTISNSLFIPVFLVGTGFLVDTRIFIRTILDYPITVSFVVGGLIFSKYIAAWVSGTIFKFSGKQKLLMWSLSVPQVAATLAATVVAYNSINSSGERLLSEVMLNSVVVLVVVTSILGPILTRAFGKKIASTS